MSWFRVKIIGETGTEIGIVEDIAGELTLTYRKQGEEWPHGKIPYKEAIVTITDGYKSCVVHDEGYSILSSIGVE